MLKQSTIAKIVLIFLIWRIGLFALAYISPQIVHPFGAKFPYYEERLMGTHLPHFIWSFGNFDGVHYLGIAKDAYAYQYTQAFFPFYPILIKALHSVVGSYLLSGLLVSNVAFIGCLIMLYKLVAKVFDEKTAMWSIIFMCAFPTSFYFGALYTESFFLLLILTSFYFYEKNNILVASLLGMAASATRLVGIFLSPILAYNKSKMNYTPLLLVPLGFLSYVAYLKIKFNNPLYFLTSQSIFGQERSMTPILLPQVFFRYLKILLTTNGLLFGNAMFELIATIFVILMLTIAFRKKIKIQWIAFSLLAVILPTLSGTLTSMPRYILVAFPIYIVLAQIKSTAYKLIIVAVFSSILVATTIIFTQGYWVA